MITFTRDWRGYAKGSSVGTLADTIEALAVAEGAAIYGGVAGPLNSYLDADNRVQALVDGGGNTVIPVVGGLSTTNNAAAASANTARIQAALTAGGLVQILAPGTYYTNDSLYIGSNTWLLLADGVMIRSFPGTNKVMLTTKSQTVPPTSVALARTTGTGVTVTWTAHGKIAGDFVWLLGATESTYRGVFRVSTVTDADNFVINTVTAPAAAPSGTLTAKPADVNISVEGGMWDYDYPNNAALNLDGFSMSFYGCANVFAKNLRFGVSTKYSLAFCAFYNANLDNVQMNNSQSDGLKIYGPGNVFNGSRIAGVNGDDVMSVQGKEGTPYLTYQIQTGDLHQIRLRGISGAQVSAKANLNIYLADDCRLYGLDVDGIDGAALNNLAVAIQKSVGETTGYAGRIRIAGLSTSSVNTIYHTTGYVEHLLIEQMQANPHLLTSGPLINFTSTASAGVIEVLDSNFSAASWPSSGSVPVITLTGVADLVNVRGNRFKKSGAGAQHAINVATGCSVKQINLVENYADSQIFVYLGGVPTVVPTINLRGNVLEGTNPVFIAGNANLNFSGNRFLNPSLGVMRFNNTFTVVATSDGSNNLVAGSWLTVVAGTPVLTLKGMDLSVDVGVTGVAKTNGGYAFNIGSARGTLVQNRLVTCNGTNWVQVDTPANVF